MSKNQGIDQSPKTTWRTFALTLAVAIAWQAMPLGIDSAEAAGRGWEGKRRISYQHQKDLFYNYYAAPGPSGAAAQMYVAPVPTPAFVGHTYVTYQPFYPHEYMHRHKRSYYTYNDGAGWTRTNVRYSTGGGSLSWLKFRLHGDRGSRFTDSLNDSISGLNRFGRH